MKYLTQTQPRVKLPKVREVVADQVRRGKSLLSSLRNDDNGTTDDLKDKLLQYIKDIKTVGMGEKKRSLETAFREEVMDSKQVAFYRYCKEQPLMVRCEDGSWVEAPVEASLNSGNHQVRLKSGSAELTTMLLHPWNHAPRQLSLSSFEMTLKNYTDKVRAQQA